MEQKIYDVGQRGEIIAPNAKILFWVFLVQTLANFMSDAKMFTWMHTPGMILGLLCAAAAVYALWRMAPASDSFRSAATVSLILLVLNLVSGLLSPVLHSEILVMILTVVTLLVSLYGTYHEFMGFSQVLADVDQKKSSDWQSLWRAFLTIQICAALVLVFGLGIPVIGLILGLVISISGLILVIWRLILLYNTAGCFKPNPEV